MTDRRTLYPRSSPMRPACSTRAGIRSIGNGAGQRVPHLVFLPADRVRDQPQSRRQFDPAKYDILLFDHAGRQIDPPRNLKATPPGTWSTISSAACDGGVEKWMVFGGSWGSPHLAYARPSRARHRAGAARIFLFTRASSTGLPLWRVDCPEGWDEFLAASRKRSGDLVGGYRRLLTCADESVQLRAAKA